ncbi:MAG: cbb3-type cytochrome oxidase assembly protein CcoS [Flavobacteriales bacterium]
MEILFLMILTSLSLAVIFLITFIISARNGQFDDDYAPAVRILLEDNPKKEQSNLKNKKDKFIKHGTSKI